RTLSKHSSRSPDHIPTAAGTFVRGATVPANPRLSRRAAKPPLPPRVFARPPWRLAFVGALAIAACAGGCSGSHGGAADDDGGGGGDSGGGGDGGGGGGDAGARARAAV